MGTSKGFSTPKGGAWTPLKNDITDMIGGDSTITPIQIIRGTLIAAGGMSVPTFSGGGGGGNTGQGGGGRAGGGGGGGRGGGGAGGGRGRSSDKRRSVGGTVSGLAGFSEAVREQGLDKALEILGIAELKDKPAAEVIAQIAEHLAEETEGPQHELLADALRNAIFDAADLGDDGSYDNLATALQGYLNREGIEGLIGLFLTQYVFDRVWTLIENHVDMKTQANGASDAMAVAVENACRSNVDDFIEDSKTAGTFAQTDWFGKDGVKRGEQLIADLEGRLIRGKVL